MPKVKVQGMVLRGIEGRPVEVEARTRPAGTGEEWIKGMAPAAAREARVRVVSALGRGDLDTVEVTVSQPNDPGIVGRPESLDLAIAVAVLSCLGSLSPSQCANVTIIGELTLGGDVRSARGLYSMIRYLPGPAIVPEADSPSAALSGATVYAAPTLEAVVKHLSGESPLLPLERYTPNPIAPARPELEELRVPIAVKRAMVIAAAGGHGLLLIGAPGMGGLRIGRGMVPLLPTPTVREILDLTAIHSAAGLLHGIGYVPARPFRAPHFTVSAAGLVGSGVAPGEATLAHGGVLFLDQVSEFRRGDLEVLAHAVSTGRSVLRSSREMVELPTRPQIVATMMPCPCGRRGRGDCRCSGESIARHWDRIKLAPEMDVRVRVDPSSDSVGWIADAVREVVFEARQRQAARYVAGRASSRLNAGLTAVELKVGENPESLAVARVARTIADLVGRDEVSPEDLEEASYFRAGAE